MTKQLRRRLFAKDNDSLSEEDSHQTKRFCPVKTEWDEESTSDSEEEVRKKIHQPKKCFAPKKSKKSSSNSDDENNDLTRTPTSPSFHPESFEASPPTYIPTLICLTPE